jgi:hypothetical protein
MHLLMYQMETMDATPGVAPGWYIWLKARTMYAAGSAAAGAPLVPWHSTSMNCSSGSLLTTVPTSWENIT